MTNQRKTLNRNRNSRCIDIYFKRNLSDRNFAILKSVTLFAVFVHHPLHQRRISPLKRDNSLQKRHERIVSVHLL